MKKDYIINWQGTDFVKYEGLLDEAHQQGLCRVSTTLIQVPHPDNGNVAIVAAEVETAKGTYSGIGDAAPNNVNRMIVPHISAHGRNQGEGPSSARCREYRRDRP